MTPIVDGLEAEFKGQVAVIRLNAEDPAVLQLMMSHALSGHPAFVVVGGEGNVTQRLPGIQTRATLQDAMAAVADSSMETP